MKIGDHPPNPNDKRRPNDLSLALWLRILQLGVEPRMGNVVSLSQLPEQFFVDSHDNTTRVC